MKKNQLITFAFLLFGIATAQAQVSATSNNAQQALTTIDHRFFIENKGQWPSEVLYLTQMGGLNTWITTKGMMYEFYKTEEINDASTPGAIPGKFEQKEYKRWGHRVGYKLIGNNAVVNTESKQKQQGYYNYLIGNDPSKHASNVGLYKEAVVKDVYNGIDMRYYFDKGLLRYDYVVHPGANPSQIHFSLEGTEKTYLNEKGELIFTTCFGEVKNADLYSYQQQDKKPIATQFTKHGESWTFALGSYEKSQTLIIDPLIYSTYIGGSNQDLSKSIALDISGNAYITGRTISANFNITTGAFQSTFAGTVDVFVTKLNNTGTALIYSTYIGGSLDDEGNSIALDTLGNAYITGFTSSPNYDITAGAFQTTKSGSTNVFVTKLNSIGTALIYSTYIGGGDDVGYSIALDAFSNAYITGNTQSSNYDITAGAYQTTFAGYSDVFITKLNSAGTALIYSTYLGGSNYEKGRSIALDAFGNAYITGYTQSQDFDTTSGAFQTTHAGGNKDVFISKLNSTGTALIYSTYIGGINDDDASSIALDSYNNAFITGANGGFYPITAGAFQTTPLSGTNPFISKLNSIGTSLIYSTYLGGSYSGYGTAIALDALGNAYITGYTSAIDYPVTAGAIQATFTGIAGGPWDVFVSKLNSTGSTLMYSTYIGGNNVDFGKSIALDDSGNAVITGYTQSPDYDTTTGAFQTINAGTYNIFVSKIGISGTSSISEITKNDWFAVYPNPSQGIYKLDFKNTITEPLFIEVFDIKGQLINTKPVSNSNSINLDISNEPAGVYILKVKANHTQEAVRLVKL